MVPRLFKTNIGDIYTTNMIDSAVDLETVTELTPSADKKGVLVAVDGDAEMIWKVVKVYTLADGQAAVKLQRIK